MGRVERAVVWILAGALAGLALLVVMAAATRAAGWSESPLSPLSPQPTPTLGPDDCPMVAWCAGVADELCVVWPGPQVRLADLSEDLQLYLVACWQARQGESYGGQLPTATPAAEEGPPLECPSACWWPR